MISHKVRNITIKPGEAWTVNGKKARTETELRLAALVFLSKAKDRTQNQVDGPTLESLIREVLVGYGKILGVQILEGEKL